VQVTELFDIRIQKPVPRLNKCLDKGGDYVEKYLKVYGKRVFHSILLINLNNFIAYVSLRFGCCTYIMIMFTGKLFY
jgi:hypothetical protein